MPTNASDLGVLRAPPMQEFVHRANTAEFCKLLVTTTDEYQCRILLRLVAEEEAKGPLHPLKSKESQTTVNVALSPISAAKRSPTAR